MTLRTVKSLADAEKPEDLFRGQWQHNRTSVLDEYKPYLDQRREEGCTNALEALGGDRSLGLSRQLRPGQRLQTSAPRHGRSPRNRRHPRVVTRWILSRPETLTEIEQSGSRPSWPTAPNSMP